MADTTYTLDSGFWNGVWTGENAEEFVFSYDRIYDSEQMNYPYVNIVTDGIFCAEQVVNNVATLVPEWSCSYSSSAGGIIVGSGSAIMLGKWVMNSTSQVVSVPSNSLLTSRRDSIIIQLNATDRAAYLIYRTGSGTAYPSITQTSSVYEYRLYNVQVPSSQVGGTPTLLDNRVTTECPAITGLLQQLDLSERLDQFDADAEAKLTELDNIIEDASAEWASFLATAQNELAVVTAEWSAMKQEIQDLVGSTNIISDIALISENYTYDGSGSVTFSSYNESTDRILVFINGMYANDTDYTMDTTGKITFLNEVDSGAVIDVFGFRVSVDGSTINDKWAQEIHTTYDGSTIQISNWSSLTMNAMVFINGFYANSSTDYVISGEGVITWRNTINNGSSIDVIVLNTLAETEEAEELGD